MVWKFLQGRGVTLFHFVLDLSSNIFWAKSIKSFIPTKHYFFRGLLFSATTGLVWLKY